MSNVSSLLEDIDACGIARNWVKDSGEKSSKHLWNTCEKGNWLMWLAIRLDIDFDLCFNILCDFFENACPENYFTIVKEDLERIKKSYREMEIISRKPGTTVLQAKVASEKEGLEDSESDFIYIYEALSCIQQTANYYLMYEKYRAANKSDGVLSYIIQLQHLNTSLKYHLKANTDLELQMANMVRERIPWETIKKHVEDYV